MSVFIGLVTLVWSVWCLIIFVVQTIGTFVIFKFYSSPNRQAVSPKLKHEDIPHVTIIRPAKGLEPELYECFAAAFRQNYPIDKTTIYICVASVNDPAYEVAKRVVEDFPAHDAKVFVEEQDPLLHGLGGHVDNLGPNPKIRNVSRAYREAKGDLLWVLDCNIWVGKGVLGRMVDHLCGYRPHGKLAKPYKFVHHLPLVVDITNEQRSAAWEAESLLPSSSFAPASTGGSGRWSTSEVLANGGGRLDEMFFATTHAKFYGAINTVGIAPCILGKSNMFRKSHLERLTDPAQNPLLSKSDESRPRGIDFFSSYICEDHLIGDLLWRSNLPGFRNHGLVYGDLAIQPMAATSVRAYVARRVRWLRVRKWTVLIATLVEPGVESLLCSFYFSFVLTTVPFFHTYLAIPQTYPAMALVWLATVLAWMTLDRRVFARLHAGLSIEADEDTPRFARGTTATTEADGAAAGRRHHRGALGTPASTRRFWSEWLPAWVGREVLALPVWTWAVLLGTTVTWRGKRFRVHTNMRVVEIDQGPPGAGGDAAAAARSARAHAAARRRTTPDMEDGRARSKGRVD